MIARGGPWPGPIDVTNTGMHSPAYREERHRALAVWAGEIVPPDAVDAFVARMEQSWLLERADEDARIAATADAARVRRARAEDEGDLVRLRGHRLTRIRPRRVA